MSAPDLATDRDLWRQAEEDCAAQYDKLLAKAQAMADALAQIGAECFVPLGARNGWRKLATERVDIARAALAAWRRA